MNNWSDTWGTINWSKDSKEDVLNKTNALIEQGVDVNMADKCGLTPLMYAVETNHTDAVKTLITSGADVNTKDKMGNNVFLRIGVFSGLNICHVNKDIVNALLEAGVSTTIKNTRGRRALNTPKKAVIKNLIRSANPDPTKVILNYVIKNNDKQHT